MTNNSEIDQLEEMKKSFLALTLEFALANKHQFFVTGRGGQAQMKG